MNQMKKILALALAVACLAGMTACGKPQEASARETAAPAVTETPLASELTGTPEPTPEPAVTPEPTAEPTPEPTAVPVVTVPQGASLEEVSGILETAVTTGNLLELYSTVARDYAPELEKGAWDIDLDNGLPEDFPETLLPGDLTGAVTDELPADMLNRKYIVLYENDTYKTTALLGSYITRLPAATRAASAEEAEAVLLIRESLKHRTDYIGSANDRHYDIYVWEAGGETVWKIEELVTNPPLSGKGVLNGDEIPKSELWFLVRDRFYSATFDMADENGSVLTFRPIGNYACVLSSVKLAEGITSVNIPQQANGLDVVEIGKRCMENNETIENVTVPAGVTRISESAFRKCAALVRADLPDTLKIIGKTAFCDCKALRDIEIPDSVQEFGERAFSGCSALEVFRIPASIRKGKSNPELPVSGKLARVVVSEGVTGLITVPDNHALACCYLPASLKSIERIVNNDMHRTVFYAPAGSYALNWLQEKGIECVACEKPEDMPQTEYVTVDGIEFRLFDGEAALYACPGKTDSFVIPEEVEGYPVTRILSYSLVCDAKNKSVIIPESVKLISYYAIPHRKDLSVSDLYIAGADTVLEAIPDNVLIHAPEDSAARQAAEKNGNPFEAWDGTIPEGLIPAP